MSIEVGNRIKNIRLSLGLSMEEFGKLFDVAALKSNVSGWELGKHLPNANRLKKIAELGNTTIDELLGERKGDDMLLKDLIEKIGYSVDEFKVEALPMLAELYETLSDIDGKKDIIGRIHGKHKNKKVTDE